MLDGWARSLADAAKSGALTKKPCNISRIETIKGPRAGALEMFAGLDSGPLMRALEKNDCATLRQFVPWQFPGTPQVFMAGRCVRVEAGWPLSMADSKIRLSSIPQRLKPDRGESWVAGINETGAIIVLSLSDFTPHFLVAGTTGSGKSVALRSAVLQLSQDPANQIVLVDGKMGESLRAVERLPGVVGPCAVDGGQIRGALGWVAAEMRRRYHSGKRDTRVVLVIDEFQELVADKAIVELIRKVVAQGRAASVHALLATQHPTVNAFGDNTTRRNLVGKIALLVMDADASRVAVGGALPRADRLLGKGDSYTCAPGSAHRTQLVYVDGDDFNDEGRFLFPRWPEYEPESVGQDLPVNWSYTGAELGVSLVSAMLDEGRGKMVDRLTMHQLGRPGAPRAIRLHRLGKAACDFLRLNYPAACLPAYTQ